MEEYSYFDNKNNIIKKMIKEQGYLTCKEEFDKDYISELLDKYDFGFVHYQKVANVGQKRKRQKLYNLWSFILATERTEYNLYIELICTLIYSIRRF